MQTTTYLIRVLVGYHIFCYVSPILMLHKIYNTCFDLFMCTDWGCSDWINKSEVLQFIVRFWLPNISVKIAPFFSRVGLILTNFEAIGRGAVDSFVSFSLFIITKEEAVLKFPTFVVWYIVWWFLTNERTSAFIIEENIVYFGWFVWKFVSENHFSVYERDEAEEVFVFFNKLFYTFSNNGQ